MRFFLIAATVGLLAAPAMAQTTPGAAAPKAPAAAPQPAAKYNTTDTPIGDLLDNPAAKAIIEKNIPGMTSNDQIDMARGMSLRAIQAYAPDDVTDARLAAIDADLAKLK